MSSVSVSDYSEKAIVVRGTLEHHGPIMEQLGGTFNEKLKGGRGWIFSKYKMSQVRNIVDKLNSGQYGNEYEQKTSSTSTAQVDSVPKSEFLSALSRIEKLEALVSNLCQAVLGTTTPVLLSVQKESQVQSSSTIEFDCEEEEDMPITERKRLTVISKK